MTNLEQRIHDLPPERFARSAHAAADLAIRAAKLAGREPPASALLIKKTSNTELGALQKQRLDNEAEVQAQAPKHAGPQAAPRTAAGDVASPDQAGVPGSNSQSRPGKEVEVARRLEERHMKLLFDRRARLAEASSKMDDFLAVSMNRIVPFDSAFNTSQLDKLVEVAEQTIYHDIGLSDRLSESASLALVRDAVDDYIRSTHGELRQIWMSVSVGDEAEADDPADQSPTSEGERG